jgi:hypothetical protein
VSLVVVEDCKPGPPALLTSGSWPPWTSFPSWTSSFESGLIYSALGLLLTRLIESSGYRD